VFEPMVRGTPDSASARSVGLGLYIVKEIARGHGGEMTLVSSNEEGTKFIFRFPSTETSSFDAGPLPNVS
jgi:sigma-B regulation protein RsbU (phosphoserine phosphatase)